MRRENISYQEMFRKIKNQLLAQRKMTRASGRDTGDGMKLSRDRVNEISHKLVAGMRKSRDFPGGNAWRSMATPVWRTGGKGK
jgi:uncharacterized protein